MAKDLLAEMVMEAEGRRRNAPPARGVNIGPAEDDEEAPVDYGGDIPDSDEGQDAPPPQGGGEEEPVDYGADIPDPDAGEDPPADVDNVGDGGAPLSNPNPGGGGGGAAPEDAGQDPDAPTDYGEGAPDPDDGGGAPPPQGGGDPNDPAAGGEEGQPQVDENGNPIDPNQAQGAEGDPNAAAQQQGEDPNQQQVDPESAEAAPDQEAEGMTPAEQTANSILLLRNYIKLHREIRHQIVRIQESRRESLLASVTYDQVIQNLTNIKDMVHKYILLIFDNAPYEENLFNFDNTIEMVQWNIEMLKKVQLAEEKARKLREKNKRKR